MCQPIDVARVVHRDGASLARACRGQLLRGGVEDQVAEAIAVQHVGQERAVADAGHGQPQPPQPPHVQVAAESGERLARGERGRDLREQIAPVEGARCCFQASDSGTRAEI